MVERRKYGVMGRGGGYCVAAEKGASKVELLVRFRHSHPNIMRNVWIFSHKQDFYGM